MGTLSQWVKLAWHVDDHSLTIVLNSRSGTKPPHPRMPTSCAQRHVYLTLGRTIQWNFALPDFITPNLSVLHLSRCSEHLICRRKTLVFFLQNFNTKAPKSAFIILDNRTNEVELKAWAGVMLWPLYYREVRTQVHAKATIHPGRKTDPHWTRGLKCHRTGLDLLECGTCGQSVTELVWTLWNVVSVGTVSQNRSGPYGMWYLWAECHRTGLDLTECGIRGHSVTVSQNRSGPYGMWYL